VEFLNVVEKESGYFFRCDYCVYWNEVYSLGDNSHNSVMSEGFWEFDHEIDTEGIPLLIQNGEQLKFTNRRVLPGFRLETEITGTYILADVPRHLGPLVPISSSIQGVLQSGCHDKGL